MISINSCSRRCGVHGRDRTRWRRLWKRCNGWLRRPTRKTRRRDSVRPRDRPRWGLPRLDRRDRAACADTATAKATSSARCAACRRMGSTVDWTNGCRTNLRREGMCRLPRLLSPHLFLHRRLIGNGSRNRDSGPALLKLIITITTIITTIFPRGRKLAWGGRLHRIFASRRSGRCRCCAANR